MMAALGASANRDRMCSTRMSSSTFDGIPTRTSATTGTRTSCLGRRLAAL
jgi:hypothetical protein